MPVAGGTVRGCRGPAELCGDGCDDGVRLETPWRQSSRTALPVTAKREAEAGFQLGLDRRVGPAAACDKEQLLGTPRPPSPLLGSRTRPADTPASAAPGASHPAPSAIPAGGRAAGRGSGHAAVVTRCINAGTSTGCLSSLAQARIPFTGVSEGLTVFIYSHFYEQLLSPF